jgi:hypothetical protein
MKRLSSLRSLPIFCALTAALTSTFGFAATVTVDITDDSPGSTQCTLRNAIGLLTLGPNSGTCAIGGVIGQNDTITFADSLVRSTISLSQGQINVDGTNPITIAGSGQIIDAHQQSRVFYVIGNLHVSNLTISGGSTTGSGGAIKAQNHATVKIDSSAIVDNEAANGGAVFSLGSVALANSTVANNHATGKGGAAYCVGSLTASNVTISANMADGKTGGIYLSSGRALVSNSVISGNVGSSTVGSDFYTTTPGAGTISYSVLGSAPLGSYLTFGGLIRTTDPGLGALADNGGLTPTMLPQVGSPAIDAGDNDSAVNTSNNLLEFDQRGVGYPRINHGTVDIGAAEFEDAIFTNGFE